MITIYKISTWHKITAEKRGNLYTVYNAVKSVFGGKWEKEELKTGLSLAQVQELKKLYN